MAARTSYGPRVVPRSRDMVVPTCVPKAGLIVEGGAGEDNVRAILRIAGGAPLKGRATGREGVETGQAEAHKLLRLLIIVADRGRSWCRVPENLAQSGTEGGGE